MFGDSLLLWIIIFPIAEIILFLCLNKHWKKSGKLGKCRLLVSMLLCAIAIFVTVNLLFSTDCRKSTVDVSPMAELSIEQIYMLEDVIKQLEYHDFITRFEVAERPTNPKLGMSYNFNWWNPESDTSLSATVLFYLDNQDAKTRITDGPKTWGRRNRLIRYDNDTEALLFHSRVFRNEYFSGSSWSRYSYIRFSNAFMILDEGENSINQNGASEFIAWICELLEEISQQKT